MSGKSWLLIGAGAVLLWTWAQRAKADPGTPPPPAGSGLFGLVDDFLEWSFPGMMKKGRVVPTYGEQAECSPPWPWKR